MKFLCSNCKGIVSLDFEAEMVNCGFCDSLCEVPEPMSSGIIIDDFMILRKLGSGGMGDVYLAHEFSLDRDVALKILKESIAQDEQLKDDFIREARAVASLNHPNIIQAYKVGEDEGMTFFAMECADGKTLQQIQGEHGVLDEMEALEVAHEIVKALGYAWEKRQLVHRDIKPENIMITNDGMTKLMDLGLSVPASEVDHTSTMISGTPQYISPEQILGDNLDIRSDFYCLGATLYHLLSGDFPFDGNLQEMVRKHIQEPPKSLKKKRPELSGHTVKIVHNLMNKDPDNRYSTASKLMKDLQYCKTLLTNARKTKKTINVQQKSGRKLEQVSKRKSGIDPAKAAVAAMVLLLVVAFVFVKALSGGSGPVSSTPKAKPKITYKGKVKKRSTAFLGETLERGLNYTYYQQKAEPEQLQNLKPDKVGFTAKPDISLKGNEDNSGYIFSGFLKITKSSPYHFYLKANDYCKVEIDGKAVITHENQRNEKMVTLDLEKGYRALKIYYYQKTSQKWLNLFIESPSLSRQVLPEAMLFRKPEPKNDIKPETKDETKPENEVKNPENTVTTNTFSFNSEWQYYDSIEDPGSNWYSKDYDDSNWQKGKGSFGYGKSPTTNLGHLRKRNICFYLRKKVILKDLNSIFKFNCTYDDGYAVFLNGEKLVLHNIRGLSHKSTAAKRIGGPDKASVILPSELLKPGENLIAVVVKNASLNSSDIHFDAELVAEKKVKEPSPLSFAKVKLPQNTQKAVLLAYENFNYKEGAAEKNGGFGWKEGWKGGKILPKSLTSVIERLNTIQSSGNQISVQGSTCSRVFDTGPESTFSKNGFLNQKKMIGKRNTSLYISFLFMAPTENPSFNVSFSKDGKSALGVASLTGDSNLHLSSGSNRKNSFARINKQMHLIVIRIDYKSGKDEIYIFRNPTPGKPMIKWPKSPFLGDFSFNQMSISAKDAFQVDEIRVGTTYQSVTPLK